MDNLWTSHFQKGGEGGGGGKAHVWSLLSNLAIQCYFCLDFTPSAQKGP